MIEISILKSGHQIAVNCPAHGQLHDSQLMRKAGLLCAVVVRILASGAGGATVNRWSGNHAPAAEDLQREVVHLRNEVQVLRQTHAPAGALRPFAPPGDETILGVSIAKHNDAQTHRPLGRGFQRQKTLMPYLARARSPTGTVARTAEPNVASPGVVSSPASPIHTRLRREEGSQTIEEDSSGAVFAGEVELAILDNLASQARDRALRQISPRVFRCKNGKSKGEEAGQCEKREIAREHPAQCRPRTDEESQTEHEKTATEPLPVEGSLSPLQEASARTCRVPTDEPCLATALAKGRQNIILEASTHHQWTSTMELTHKVSILGNCGRTVALGSWELAAVLGGAMKNMDLRNEFGSSIAIVQVPAPPLTPGVCHVCPRCLRQRMLSAMTQHRERGCEHGREPGSSIGVPSGVQALLRFATTPLQDFRRPVHPPPSFWPVMRR